MDGVRLALSADDANILQLVSDCFPGLRRQAVRWHVRFGIGHRVQCGLGVACSGEHPGHVAGLGAPSALLRPQMGLDQPEEGAPGLHRRAEIVHRHGLDPLSILHRGPARGEDVVGDVPQRLSDRLLRPQPRLFTHATVI